MSNVLIGIIGIILFIGLALAGALVLGDDFRRSSSASKAAQTTQQLQQVAAAVDMYQLKTGSTIEIGTSMASLTPRFLKSVPVLPSGYSRARIYDDYGRTSDGEAAAMTATVLAGDAAEDVCKAIQEQMAGSQAYETVTSSPNIPKTPVSGCFRTGGTAIYEFPANSYVAYTRF